ncbi:MAG: cytochrome P460 family protein [Gemmataceae bacterium]
MIFRWLLGAGLVVAVSALGWYWRPGQRAEILPRPSSLSVREFEEVLFNFLNERRYQSLGWAVDKGVRDTGPFIDGKHYGTHPAVRVYYSPEVIQWLKGGRVGAIPDGAMIVKEQYPEPSARHVGKNEAELWAELKSWTVMVKDSKGSQDGWFWSNPEKGQCTSNLHAYPFEYPTSGFGIYCVRCHAVTQSAGTKTTDPDNEFTFSALRNIAGFPGQPIRYQVDDSWRKEEHNSSPSPSSSHSRCRMPKSPERPKRSASSEFAKFYDAVKLSQPTEVVAIPPITHDHVVPQRGSQFVTSDQCLSCHAGMTAPFGPSMFVPFGQSTDYGAPGWDVSPHGEWRWSAMGLAGRDPVFYAQVETELKLIQRDFGADPRHAKALQGALVDTCLRCHGAMGHRQFTSDDQSKKGTFSTTHTGTTDGSLSHYGALARDGVSCVVCHRMQAKPQPGEDQRPYLKYFLETQITGNYHLGPANEIYGPFKDDEIAPYAMEHATGWKPKQGTFLKSSQMCGTCHTIALPAIDDPVTNDGHIDEVRKTQTVELFQKCHHHVEQATYLEWLNSEYENEVNPKNLKAKTCQDCHMSRDLVDERNGIDVSNIMTRIANVQDTTYPESENLAPAEQLNIRLREKDYRRHNFGGLNSLLIEMFRQHPDVLGVRTTDVMTGSKIDAENALASITRRARHETADLSVTLSPDARHIEAKVLVTNKAGHRFPSGVAFRRSFLEVALVRPPKDGRPEEIVWASGRTNELGVLVGADGSPLPTEFFERDANGQQQFQPHHEVIDSENQVQIYETLIRNKKEELTTSFVRGCGIAKDNRLLPRGWKLDGPGPELSGRFLEATYPDSQTLKDQRYANGSGTDEVIYKMPRPKAADGDLQVRATLYYQPMPPYFLATLFKTAPEGEATRRLYSLLGHLKLEGTDFHGWKLLVATASAPVARSK